jgi:hypothetical protein
MGAVDGEVASVDDEIRALTAEVGDHALERVPAAVDVGHDGWSHPCIFAFGFGKRC